MTDTSLQAEITRLCEALEFYADPETYHAVMVLGDGSFGAFLDDLVQDHGHVDYDRPMPGSRARAALGITYEGVDGHQCDESCSVIDIEAHKAFASRDGEWVQIGLVHDAHPAKRMILKTSPEEAIEIAGLVLDTLTSDEQSRLLPGLDFVQAVAKMQAMAGDIPDDEAPLASCTRCHRRSWDRAGMNGLCGIPQPDGESCKGMMMPYDQADIDPAAQREAWDGR